MWTEVTCDVLDAGFVGPRPQLRLRREIRYKRGEHLQSNHKHKSMSLASSPSPHHRHPRLLSSSGSCLPIPIHTFTHTPSSSPTLLPPTGCDDHHLRRPTATLLLSPIQNMCGISSLAFTTVAHRDFLYLRTAGIHFGPSPLPLFSQSLSKTPYDRSSFSQKKKKHHNDHLLPDHFLTSHNTPPPFP